MLCFKKNLIFIIIIILLAFFSISSCDKNNDIKYNSEELLQAFSAVQETENIKEEKEETEPPTEIISGIVSFTTEDETEKVTDDIKITETSEKLYVITPSGKKYHYPTCRTAKNIKQYLTKEEAEQMGYEPCKICKPE